MKKQKQAKKDKLTLKTTKVRTLTPVELTVVAGGFNAGCMCSTTKPE